MLKFSSVLFRPTQNKGAHTNSAAKSARALNGDELVVLQRFYEQLCVVVEQQRMSDPTSLMIVHKVKSLMEQGVFLHKPLLMQVRPRAEPRAGTGWGCAIV